MLNKYRQNKLSEKIEAVKGVAKTTIRYTILAGIGLGVSAAIWAVAFTALWFNSHYVEFRSPLIVQSPVVVKRVLKTTEVKRENEKKVEAKVNQSDKYQDGELIVERKK